MYTFEASAGAVLSLVARHETVYVGCQDGHVKVFDLETKTLVRTIIAQEVSFHRSFVFSQIGDNLIHFS